jgi:hypothetical protein
VARGRLRRGLAGVDRRSARRTRLAAVAIVEVGAIRRRAALNRAQRRATRLCARALRRVPVIARAVAAFPQAVDGRVKNF